MVFLHGLCLSQYEWALQRDAVVRVFGGSVRVISPDHRGHGQSGSAPVGTYRVEQLADDLRQVLKALGVTGPVVLVGHSMGSMAALCLAGQARSSDRFEIVGLVLCATAAGRLAERGLGRMLTIPVLGAVAAAVDHVPALATRIVATPLSAALSRLSHHGRASQQAFAAVVADALSNAALATAVGFLPSLRRFDQYAVLPRIEAHTVIISGGADILTPVAHAAEMAAVIPRAEHIHVPECGHMLPQEAPQCVSDAVCRTLRRVRARSRVRRGSVATVPAS
ncbi:alpha/beta fold hydrolase [Mycobacterium sp. DBP42]|uniref:alpha/beta fold hydrolase n=1 Tax=Mycobacterium sp. DBP42 TaxID=2545267 RepID=UPI00148673B5|nr:alpha/beta hydrolase [Mycobacterium sp. DBP42]